VRWGVCDFSDLGAQGTGFALQVLGEAKVVILFGLVGRLGGLLGQPEDFVF
jgi:hypothetical protein